MTWLLLLIVLIVLAGGWWGWPLAAALFGSRAIHDKTSALGKITELMHGCGVRLRGQVFHLLVCHGPVATPEATFVISMVQRRVSGRRRPSKEGAIARLCSPKFYVQRYALPDSQLAVMTEVTPDCVNDLIGACMGLHFDPERPRKLTCLR